METYTAGYCTEPKRGLTLAEAAYEVLGYDSQTYRIKRTDYGWSLWFKKLSWPAMRETMIDSIEDDEDAATADIFRQVIDSSEYFTCDNFVCMTDEAYNEMIAGQD